MYHVSAQGIDERMINVHYYYYILTSVPLRENIRQFWVFNRGDLNISAAAVPNNKDTFKTKRNGKLQYIKLFKQ